MRRGFWLLALLWLPAGIVATAIVRIVGGSEPLADRAMWTPMVLMAAQFADFRDGPAAFRWHSPVGGCGASVTGELPGRLAWDSVQLPSWPP